MEDKDFNHDNFQNPMPFSVPNQESEIANDEYIKKLIEENERLKDQIKLAGQEENALQV